LRCAADPGSIAPHLKCLGPGSVEQREERCTASGTREILLHILAGGGPNADVRKMSGTVIPLPVTSVYP
jgi:hypothetical protein